MSDTFSISHSHIRVPPPDSPRRLLPLGLPELQTPNPNPGCRLISPPDSPQRLLLVGRFRERREVGRQPGSVALQRRGAHSSGVASKRGARRQESDGPGGLQR